jgi:hypothetical protein
MPDQTIQNLRQLRQRKSELQTIILKQEFQITTGYNALKDELFAFDNLQSGVFDLATLKSKVIPYISQSLVRLAVNGWLKPKSKLVQRVALFSGTYMVQKLLEALGKKVIKRFLSSKS